MVVRIVIALMLAFQSSAAMAQMLRSADTLPFGHPTVQSVESIGQSLRERTNGRLYIGDLGAGAASSESFLVAQVRLGKLDMARVNLNALNNIAPLTVVPTLPFVFESKAHQRRALDGALGRDLLASLEPAGLVGLALYDSGSYCFFSRTGFVNTVADLRGKRIRFQKGDTSDVMFRALGAQPMTVPHSQLFAALKSGAIDVVEGSLSDYLALNFFTVAPYFTVSQHAEPPSILIMSRRRWESLSKNDQELVRQAAEASVESQRTLMDAYEAQAMARASEMGAGLSYDFDRQSFRDAFASLYSLVVREPQQLARVKQLAVGEAEPARPKGTK